MAISDDQWLDQEFAGCGKLQDSAHRRELLCLTTEMGGRRAMEGFRRRLAMGPSTACSRQAGATRCLGCGKEFPT